MSALAHLLQYPGAMILLAHGDNDLLGVMYDGLAAHGFRVQAARHGAELLARLRALPRPPCVVVVDWRIALDERCGVLAALSEPLELPVVALSALPVKDLPSSVSLLRKPFGWQQLVSAVRAHCGASCACTREPARPASIAAS